MFRRKKNAMGQMTGEYALLLFIVVGVLASMTVYFKRTLQARIRDGRQAMVGVVRDYSYTDPATGDVHTFNSLLYYEYEPYYANRLSEVEIYDNNNKALLPGGSTGIYRETLDHTTRSKTQSEQFAPNDAD